MALKDLLKRAFQKKEKFKEMQDDVNMQQKVVELQKTSNERDLENFQEEERQERIKEQLEQFKKKERDKLFRSSALDKGNILHKGNPILTKGSMFGMKSTLLGGGNMFFK